MSPKKSVNRQYQVLIDDDDIAHAQYPFIRWIYSIMNNDEEHISLCGYQKIRGYGSTNDDPRTSSTYFSRFNQYFLHQVDSTDTLQSIGLKYNVPLFELKRLNRLW